MWRVAAAFLAAFSLFISCSGGEKEGPRGSPGHGGSGGVAGGGEGGEGGSGGSGGMGGAGDSGGSGGAGGSGGMGGGGGTDEGRLSKIEGRVYDNDGKPLLGAFIAVDGNFKDLRATAADGSFSFPDVGSTYRLTVFHDRQLFDLYEMTTRHPQVDFSMRFTAWADIFLTIKDEESLSGHTYVGMTVPVGHEGDGEYFAEWSPASNEKKADLVVLHAEAKDGCPHEYLGMGRATNLLLKLDDEIHVEVEIDEDAPPTRDVSIAWDLGGFEERASAGLTAVLVEGAVINVWCPLPSPHLYRIPKEGGRFFMQGNDDSGMYYARKIVRVPEGDSVEITFPEEVPLELVEPSDGDENVILHPTLRWTRIPKATRQIVEVGSGRTSATIILPGNVSRLKLDDYAELGWQLTPNEDQTWSIYSLHAYEVSPEEAIESYLDRANAGTMEFEYYHTYARFKTGE